MVSRFIIFAALAALAQVPGTATKDQKPNSSAYEGIKAEEAAAADEARKGTEQIFTSIKNVDARVKNGTHDQIKDIGKGANTKEYNYYKNHVDCVLRSIETAQPGAAPLIRQVRIAAYSGIEHAVKALRNGLLLVKSKNSTEVKYAVKQFEKECVAGVEMVVNNSYRAVLCNRNPYSPVGSKIMSTKHRAIAVLKKSIACMFNAIKLLLTKSCPDLYFHELDGSATYEYFDKDAVTNFMEDNKNVFSAVYIILEDNNPYGQW